MSTPSSNNFIQLRDLSLSPTYSRTSPTARLAPPPPQITLTDSISTVPLNDALGHLLRQSQHIQRSIQTLLDAQSAGLLAGYDRSSLPPSRTSSPSLSRSPAPGSRHESATPTSGSPSSPSHLLRSPPSERSTSRVPKPIVTPVRQPKQRPLSLSSARRGLLKSMYSLAEVKGAEAEILEKQTQRQDGTLTSLASLERKKASIEREIARIEKHKEYGLQKVQEAKTEEDAIGAEIRQLEKRIDELKSRMFVVRRERETRENRLEAELSSWKASREGVDRDLKGEIESVVRERKRGPSHSEVWRLPRERRTVGLVREGLEVEKKELRRKVKEVREEEEAALGGAEMWIKVTDAVKGVEKGLKEELMHSARGREALVENGNAKGVETGRGMRRVLDDMDAAGDLITEQLALAEERNWTLLVCCIGAELEAMREGREVLQRLLSEGDGEDLSRTQSSGQLSRYQTAIHSYQSIVSKGNGDDDDNDKVKAKQGPVVVNSQPSDAAHSQPSEDLLIERPEDEHDDGPGPDLLVSHENGF